MNHTTQEDTSRKESLLKYWQENSMTLDKTYFIGSMVCFLFLANIFCTSQLITVLMLVFLLLALTSLALTVVIVIVIFNQNNNYLIILADENKQSEHERFKKILTRYDASAKCLFIAGFLCSAIFIVLFVISNVTVY